MSFKITYYKYTTTDLYYIKNRTIRKKILTSPIPSGFYMNINYSILYDKKYVYIVEFNNVTIYQRADARFAADGSLMLGDGPYTVENLCINRDNNGNYTYNITTTNVYDNYHNRGIRCNISCNGDQDINRWNKILLTLFKFICVDSVKLLMKLIILLF